MEKLTPLYQKHVDAGGKIVPFAGYMLPVEYKTGVIAEHTATRTAAGLFDVSHMGEIIFEGEDTLPALQHLLCNDMSDMYIGRARYSPMLNENGGIVDDLIVYKLGETRYFVVVNASNKDKDFAHMKANTNGRVTVTDASERYGQIALQGPRSHDIITKLAPEEDIPVKYYSCKEHAKVAGLDTILSKTGYTGEDGYEIYCAAGDAGKLWDALIKAGAEFGLIPCGLGARDTLRLEAAMPLYGHEMDDGVSPLETGLGFAVKTAKEEFIGREALIRAGEPKRARIGMKVTGRGIIREHETVFRDGKEIGRTTSGTYSPTLKAGIAMALVDVGNTEIGTALTVDVRGRTVEAEIVPLPFYKRAK